MKTLIIIDVQNDFLAQGALAVPKGDQILPVIVKLIPKFQLVIATSDWHPKHHISFATTHGLKPGDQIEVEGRKEVLWPEHCLQNTEGAALAIDPSAVDKVIYKGTDVGIDSYSAFFDNKKGRATELQAFLDSNGAKELYFCGLALEYCVYFSVLDALNLGYVAYVIEDGCRAMNESDARKARLDMVGKGAQFIHSSELEFEE